MDDPQILAESQNAEAINAAAVAMEASQKAHESTMHSVVINALKEVLSDENGSPLLVKRIPFICNDIRDIKNDMRWMKWIGYGVMTGIGLLALKSLGI